jgi:hypothetical protein
MIHVKKNKKKIWCEFVQNMLTQINQVKSRTTSLFFYSVQIVLGWFNQVKSNLRSPIGFGLTRSNQT